MRPVAPLGEKLGAMKVVILVVALLVTLDPLVKTAAEIVTKYVSAPIEASSWTTAQKKVFPGTV